MDKAALLGMSVKTDEFEIVGVGTITLRGITRWEMLHVIHLEGKPAKQEQAMLRFGLVDPAMTEDDIAAWQKVAPGGLLNKIAMKINELSGLGKDAAKSDLPADGDDGS